MKKAILASLPLFATTFVNANDLYDDTEKSWLDSDRFSFSVSAGKSRFSYDDSDYMSEFDEAYENYFKQSSTHIAASVNYDINDYFTASINYQNLGEYSGVKGFGANNEIFGFPTTGLASTVRVSGFGLSLTAQYPITKYLSPYARVGTLAYTAKETDIYIITRDNEQPVRHSITDDVSKDRKQSFQYALGLSVNVAKHASIFIEAQNSELDLVDFGQLPNVASYNIGVTTRF
jgi:hypothetical protein